MSSVLCTFYFERPNIWTDTKIRNSPHVKPTGSNTMNSLMCPVGVHEVGAGTTWGGLLMLKGATIRSQHKVITQVRIGILPSARLESLQKNYQWYYLYKDEHGYSAIAASYILGHSRAFAPAMWVSSVWEESNVSSSRNLHIIVGWSLTSLKHKECRVVLDYLYSAKFFYNPFTTKRGLASLTTTLMT